MNLKLLLRDCRRKKAEDLDLSGQELSIVPEEVWELKELKRLNLSHNNLSRLDNRIEGL